ncbi:MAG: toxin-antitoxin system YwqK family antitoxin [Flavobacteriales bacterium]|nr:toxin-antitoxin system YwqK family antitoxin [Flavobacteriales bacterium]
MPVRCFTAFPVAALLLLFVGQAAAAQAGTAATDTLNRVDQQGRKQGWWRITGPVEDKPDYGTGALYEEGRYVDNRRSGTWKRYWPNGRTQSQIHYEKGLPKGKYATFYADGKPEEQGFWDVDRNTGTFKRWHANGNPAQDFVFDAHGLRDGIQKYYHENGRLAVEVRIVQGREEGMMKRYYPSGELQETMEFHAGVFDAKSFKAYRSTKPAAEATGVAKAKPAPAKAAKETTNAVKFLADGWNTLYDAQHRLSQQGHFRQGRLWNGKVYQYDGNGILFRIEFYSEGRFVGNVPLTADDR